MRGPSGTTFFPKSGVLWALLCTAVAAAPVQGDPAYTLPDPTQVDLVKDRLAPLQFLSFAAKYEYCGYLCRTPDGDLVFTEMVRGGHNGCTPEMPKNDLTRIASLHTHGAYDPTVPAEFPTVRDMESDRREGVTGYIATPGGRLWFIDSQAMTAVQLCGLGCLPQDPNFRAGDDGPIARMYTHDALKALENPAGVNP